ncbi:hypothetical protein FOCC_FOCC002701 [Frankliniella occidentalis]|nr:hypothetical protein FOCC_FOCC002701 [Frankliniella occidentalis]
MLCMACEGKKGREKEEEDEDEDEEEEEEDEDEEEEEEEDEEEECVIKHAARVTGDDKGAKGVPGTANVCRCQVMPFIASGRHELWNGRTEGRNSLAGQSGGAEAGAGTPGPGHLTD